ncbi:MAG TPA: LLM class flavin-dependent oxidoreductase [Jatrophihabitans sp.]|jgi:alkanesulfonate monooxygenase SsuD/methylene tetrahydromethanopterin reductase-like flavin-dependent oxidoreductase (luciferase family)|nr:LLM class flavin-dependent oxidoreductase [Jatrophihabitans sp.]
MSATKQSILVGVGITASAAPDADPLGDALAAEAAGFDFVSTSDHPVGETPSYETSVLLTWIAARTQRITVASRVFAVPFRRPAMLAKAAESLHRLSGGRLVLGLGGGYADDEIAALGGPVPTPREKVDGLADAIRIMRGAWAGTSFSHKGGVYAVDDLQLAPSPVDPIPIWVGTYGPRALTVTGRLADGWIPSLGFAPPSQIPALLDRIRDAAAAAGRSPDAVRAVYNVPVRLGAYERSGELLAGRPAEIAEQLIALTDLGFTGFNLIPEQPGEVPVLGAEVLPLLRR